MAALDLGLAISISGLAFRRGEEPTAEVAAIVPAERLLVETDSPFLSPPGAPAAGTPRVGTDHGRLGRGAAGIARRHRGDGRVRRSPRRCYDRTFPHRG
jgi:Tat protein secretion system quality control protein TatD with DNase activity